MSDPVRPPDLTCDDVRELAGSFVLGALPESEAAAVRRHLASCADSHAEIAELGGVVAVLGEAVPVVEPPASLKGRIMAAAAAERPAATSVAIPTAAETAPIPFPTPDQRVERSAAKSSTSRLAWAMRIAAVVAIVALAGWNLLLQGQLTDTQRSQQEVAAVLHAAQQPGSMAAILSPDGGTGSGIAAITSAGVLTMAMRDLTPTSGNQVYEAWVIASDGVPVPLGSFQVGRAGTSAFAASGLPSADGIVLALTLEPAPGATTPTMPIISKGVTSTAG